MSGGDRRVEEGVTRREAVRLGVATALMMLGPSAWPAARFSMFQAVPAVPDVDHLVWGSPDLSLGMAHFEQLTGVRPAVGGRHPSRGTQNALVSLGSRQYVEILAPDPSQADVATDRVRVLRGLQAPRLLTWCALTRDANALADRIRAAGKRVDRLERGARERPDGATLRWVNLYIAGHDEDVVPYAIEWTQGTAHPAETSPGGCELRSLRLEHPAPQTMNALLEAMGLSIRVVAGVEPKLTAVLRTPNGEVQLT